MSRGAHHRYSHDSMHRMLAAAYCKDDNDPKDGPLRQALFCPYYVALTGVLGMDWGVIVNPKSEKFGQLVFEHDECGCHWNGDDNPHPGDWQIEADSWLEKRRRHG